MAPKLEMVVSVVRINILIPTATNAYFWRDISLFQMKITMGNAIPREMGGPHGEWCSWEEKLLKVVKK